MKQWLFLLILLIAANLMSQTDDKLVKIDSFFREFNHPDVPGAAVMVIQNGKILFEKAYGLAELQQKTPCTTRTNFRLASLTKQFTAMSVMMLAEQKKLSLDDRMTKYIPEFPAYGTEITIRELLNHRSGLLDYEDYMPKDLTIPLSDRNVLYILRQQKETYFPPGTQFRYSNTGYAFLSLIVEVVSGNTFADFLKRNIFEPLHMTDTLAYEAGISTIPNRAYGYAKEGAGFQPSDQSLTSSVLGDGGVYSSVDDLYKWDQALYTEKLVSKKMLQQAFTSVPVETDMPGSGYGFGWYVGKYRGTDYIWHYGSTCGFSTRIERFPEKKFTVIILTNRRDAQISDIGKQIADLYF
jgi:CubicO group peptidase (beta-lactamase class C family)